MFGGYDVKLMAIPFSHDPGADDDLVCFVAHQSMEILAASWTQSNAVNASTANYFDIALYNGGTSGTSLTSIAGTIGGTGGWSALTPTAFTIDNGTVTAGQVVKLRYNEEGTGTFANAVLTISYVNGVA